jgi:hypothetical protein
MYLQIATPLVFLFLAIASFAPVASYWAGWWAAYYGALFVCWVVAAVVAMRRVTQEERKRRMEYIKKLRELDGGKTEATDAGVDAVRLADRDKGGVAALDLPHRT